MNKKTRPLSILIRITELPITPSPCTFAYSFSGPLAQTFEHFQLCDCRRSTDFFPSPLASPAPPAPTLLRNYFCATRPPLVQQHPGLTHRSANRLADAAVPRLVLQTPPHSPTP